MRKTRSSTKIAIGFVLLAAGAYFGYGFISGMIVMREKFDAIQPGNVNLVGVDTSQGYYIIVANQIAQLVRGSQGEFEAAEHDESAASDPQKKRVPIREMLQSLQGDERALGEFVMALNDMTDAEFPAYPKVWKAEDIQAAIRGDAELRARLEKDLNLKLDGTPLGHVSLSAIEEGIVIDSPVGVPVQVGATKTLLTGRIQEQYIPNFSKRLWSQVSEKSNLTPEIVAGSYAAMAQELKDKPAEKENIQESLLGRIDPSRLRAFGSVPEKILNSAQVIVSDRLIESASYDSYKTGDGKQLYDLKLQLNDEGRRRLWQYSKKHPRSQLLLTWEGIAIAAPRISGELALSEVTIKQLTDEGLVRDAVDSINQARKGN